MRRRERRAEIAGIEGYERMPLFRIVVGPVRAVRNEPLTLGWRDPLAVSIVGWFERFSRTPGEGCGG